MVAVHRIAVLHPIDTHRAAGSRSAATDRSAQGRHLRLVGCDQGARRRSIAGPVTTSPLSTLAVAAVMATLVLVVLVRGVQGAPPAASWDDLGSGETTGVMASTAAPAHAAGAISSATITVHPDDTWATIAAAVAPDADPVDVARQLASANGGYRLEPGQVLAIPELD